MSGKVLEQTALRAAAELVPASGRAGDRGRNLEETGWEEIGRKATFTWPLWDVPVAPAVVRSLLQLGEIVADPFDGAALRARGIAALCRSRRVKVGEGANYKLNFTPARAVWT